MYALKLENTRIQCILESNLIDAQLCKTIWTYIWRTRIGAVKFSLHDIFTQFTDAGCGRSQTHKQLTMLSLYCMSHTIEIVVCSHGHWCVWNWCPLMIYHDGRDRLNCRIEFILFFCIWYSRIQAHPHTNAQEKSHTIYLI